MSEVESVQEGSRWRYARPEADTVATWFKTQPLDEGMEHADFIAGVVLIPASEKVKRQRTDNRGTEDTYEMTFTPYVRVDTRVTYFRKLAEAKGLIAVIEPAEVPQINSGPLANVHMPEGYWWYVTGGGTDATRYLCCTMRVALYEPDDWFNQGHDTNGGPARRLQAVRFGVSTKQVSPTDPNALAKAETGAIGRALGVAGILVIGTGIATAEDMQDSTFVQAVPELPAAGAAPETSEQVNERLVSLQGELQRVHPDGWTQFAAWWQERAKAASWTGLPDAPLEVRRGMTKRMEDLIAEAPEAASADA